MIGFVDWLGKVPGGLGRDAVPEFDSPTVGKTWGKMTDSARKPIRVPAILRRSQSRAPKLRSHLASSISNLPNSFLRSLIASVTSMYL